MSASGTLVASHSRVCCMATVSNLLIVMLLAGSPLANLVCFDACEEQLTHAARCHQQLTAPVEPTMGRADDCGTTLVGEGPFLREERTPLVALLAMSVPTTAIPTMTSVDASVITSPAVIGWLITKPVLRL
jgi:hypothetical protein